MSCLLRLGIYAFLFKRILLDQLTMIVFNRLSIRMGHPEDADIFHFIYVSVSHGFESSVSIGAVTQPTSLLLVGCFAMFSYSSVCLSTTFNLIWTSFCRRGTDVSGSCWSQLTAWSGKCRFFVPDLSHLRNGIDCYMMGRVFTDARAADARRMHSLSTLTA